MITGARVAALVPMRHESHRVKQKNYRDFNGRPLFHWIIRSLLECPSVDIIGIDTDSPVVKAQALSMGNKIVVIDRPAGLLGDKVPMNDILLHDIDQVPAEIYLQTHSTNPLLTSASIEKALKTFTDAKENFDSLFSVTRWQARFWDKDGHAVNHEPARLERTQDLSPLYEENSNIYIFSGDVLRQRKNRIGFKPVVFEISRLEAVDIDEEEDFLLAEYLHKWQQARGRGNEK